MADAGHGTGADRETGAETVVRATYDWSSTSPIAGVVETVASAAGRDPTGIEPLYDRIDPDAMDALVSSAESTHGTTTVTFTFARHVVTVDADGTVEVRPSYTGDRKPQ